MSHCRLSLCLLPRSTLYLWLWSPLVVASDSCHKQGTPSICKDQERCSTAPLGSAAQRVHEAEKLFWSLGILKHLLDLFHFRPLEQYLVYVEASFSRLHATKECAAYTTKERHPPAESKQCSRCGLEDCCNITVTTVKRQTCNTVTTVKRQTCRPSRPSQHRRKLQTK